MHKLFTGKLFMQSLGVSLFVSQSAYSFKCLELILCHTSVQLNKREGNHPDVGKFSVFLDIFIFILVLLSSRGSLLLEGE